MLSRKQHVLAGFACVCLAAVLIATFIFERHHKSSNPLQDVRKIIRDIGSTTGFDAGDINIPSNASPEEVVQRLVEYMAQPDPQGTEKSRKAAMEALARIGPPTVPKLIRAIQTAPNTAAAIPFVGESTSPERLIREETLKIQARAALVLGKIGDARALPVLTGLLADDDPMRVYVKEAIANIEEFNGHSHGPPIDRVSSDEGAYEVYSAAIREAFLTGLGETDGSRAGPWLAVIEDHTVPHAAVGTNSLRLSGVVVTDGAGDPVDLAARWTIVENPVEMTTVQDFRHKNQDSISLVPRFTLAKWVLVGNRELNRARGWPAYYRRYPHSLGIIVLSRVGFNIERDQAFLYIGRMCGPKCGEGDYVLLRKEGGAWFVRHKEMLWVS